MEREKLGDSERCAATGKHAGRLAKAVVDTLVES